MNEIQLHRIDLNLLVVFEALMDEGSVIAAAERLNKTPSAVSHALARLRQQICDPLLVKVGGRMVPSPHAVSLIEDVRPILRGIKRALAVPAPFDPATSDRVFRLACPMWPAILSRILAEVHQVAPGVRLEWLAPTYRAFTDVSEGLVDLAHLGGDTRLPDGLDQVDLSPMTWTSFVRAGHPALSDWGAKAWRTYPHVQVSIANTVRSPLDAPTHAAFPGRRVGALISEFSSLGPLLANSDLIGTFPRPILAWDMAVHGLRPLAPPIALAPFRARFFWSSRLASDPASHWIREIVLRVHAQMNGEAEDLVARAMAPGQP